jgi:pyruvate/2-oxoglutarate dehydrogenase complex dihydrolipoamide acyltransferase (E2) component
VDVIVTEQVLGEESEADLVEWLVADGASVQAGQPIAELETAKVRVQIESPAAGTVSILVGPSSVVELNAVIARVA